MDTRSLEPQDLQMMIPSPTLVLNSDARATAVTSYAGAVVTEIQSPLTITDIDNSGFNRENHEAICGDSDDDASVPPQSGGEVVDMNEGQDEAHILNLEKTLLEQAVYSEDEAYMLYCDYAQALGFNVRRGKQYYFMGTKRIRSKTYCCSKEGVKDDKPDTSSVSYKKPESRTGCKAMISFSCDESGEWKAARFVKQHNHQMSPPYTKPLVRSGQAILAANVYGSGGSPESPSDHDRIRDLSLQLSLAKNRAETFERQAATYKRQLHLIVEHIEEHNQALSKKIQKALNSLKEVEAKERTL